MTNYITRELGKALLERSQAAEQRNIELEGKLFDESCDKVEAELRLAAVIEQVNAIGESVDLMNDILADLRETLDATP